MSLVRPVPDGDIEALSTVAVFLGYLERDDPKAMWGSFRIDETIEALAHLVGVTPAAIRSISEGIEP